VENTGRKGFGELYGKKEQNIGLKRKGEHMSGEERGGK